MLSWAQDGNITSDGNRYPKFEARIPKFGTKSKVPNSKALFCFAVFEPLNFEFVSDFDIRIPDLPIFPAFWGPAGPG
jgi:hypothetical protein